MLLNFTNVRIIFLAVLVMGLTDGCSRDIAVRPKKVQPFPVHLEFGGTYKDVSVEKIIWNRLFCKNCMFHVTEETQTPYRLQVEYNRIIDPKKLGLVILTGAMAPVEAGFSYSLRVYIFEHNRVLKEYIYEKETVEETDSAFGNMFSPFHKTNNKSKEVFTELIDTFLQDVIRDKPLPQSVISDS